MPYLTVTEIDRVVTNMAQRYPATSTLITLPNASDGNRTSHALQIGAGQPGTRDTVVVTGGVHAREWGSSDIVIYFALGLLLAYQNNRGLRYGHKDFSAQEVRALVENLHIVIFPLVNPDGLHHSQTVRPMWRKNRRSVCAHDAHRGVDINRNFDFLFNYGTAFHPQSGVAVTNNSCHPNADERDCYQGPNAFSEAETQNVRWLLNRYTRTRWYVDVHNYGETIMYSWGDDRNQTTNAQMNFTNAAYNGRRGRGDLGVYGEYITQADLAEARALGNAFHDALYQVRGRDYTVKPSWDLYPTAGASDDYTFARHIVSNLNSKAYSFTVEFGQAFTAPYATTRPVITDVSAGLMGLCLRARTNAAPVQGGPPAQGGVPVPAQTVPQGQAPQGGPPPTQGTVVG